MDINHSEHLQITNQEFSKIFPFYMVLDRDLRIESYGPSMHKLFPALTVGIQFDHHWNIIRPKIEHFDIPSFVEITGRLTTIECHFKPGLIFKGQFEILAIENKYVFLGSPSFSTTDLVIEHNLTLDDFSHHDSLLDMLHVLKNNEIANDELKVLIDKINLQKKQLIQDKVELQRKAKMLKAISLATEVLLSNKDFDEAINISLRSIGDSVDIDRIYLFEINKDAKGHLVSSQRFEWTSGKVSSEIYNPELQNLPLTNFPELLNKLIKKEPFEAITSELNDGSFLKKLMIEQDILSILIIPVFFKGTFWGYIGYDDCTAERNWPDDEILLLRSFANSISNAIERTSTSKELYNLALFHLESPYPVYRINLKGEILLKNGPAEKLSYLEVNHVKRRDVVLFRFLSRLLNPNRRMETFETSNFDQFYLATAILSETNEYINIYLSNITQQKEAENALKQSNNQFRVQEEKYRNIISNMNLGLLEVDNEDHILFCNQSFEAISGYHLKEIKGKRAGSLLIAENHSDVINQKNRLRVQGKSDSYEVLVKNKRGEARWWLISGAPNFNDQGEIIGSIGIHLDITEQKRLGVELQKALKLSEEASKAKEAFLSNMSHEIRTPLNAIIGMIRELNKEALTAKQKSYLQSTNVASQHLLSIVNNILDISKIEAGELKIDHHHFQIRQVIDSVASIIRNEAIEKNLGFEVKIDEKVAQSFVGDATRIRQILINLTGNAIKFTTKGSVSVRCSCSNATRSSQLLHFVIKDTGIGMDKKYLDKLFNKFQQENNAISRKFGGTGLGLVITKQLIDLMNGHIEVKSKKGAGTEIHVTLSLPVGETNSAGINNESSDELSLEHLRILLVEDNEMNRLVVNNSLSPYLVQISEATNGLEAVELLKKESFDIILMDIQMPEMNGMEATQVIRKELKIHTPIIALSANAFKSEIDKCLAIGMNDYLTKPFEENELIRTISRHAGNAMLVSNPATVNTEMTRPNQSLYDLSNLHEISRGNNDFVEKMLQLFVNIIPTAMNTIHNAFEINDITTIKKTAHKIKPSIDNLRISSIHQDIRNLENYPLEDVDKSKLKELIVKIEFVLMQTIVQIKENKLL